jgi:hypothetical protein
VIEILVLTLFFCFAGGLVAAVIGFYQYINLPGSGRAVRRLRRLSLLLGVVAMLGGSAALCLFVLLALRH